MGTIGGGERKKRDGVAGRAGRCRTFNPNERMTASVRFFSMTEIRSWPHNNDGAPRCVHRYWYSGSAVSLFPEEKITELIMLVILTHILQIAITTTKTIIY